MSQALIRHQAGAAEIAAPSAVAATLDETLNLGQLLARSGYFSDAREAAQAVVKILAGREIGLGPIAAMTGIYLVKGRVTLSANLMATAINRSGRYRYRVRRLDERGCELVFFEGAEELGVSGFTDADAKRAGLLGQAGPWTQYPRNMYFARALSNGAKWYCPDIFGGPVYTPEELGARVDAAGEVIAPEPPEPRAPTPPPEGVNADPTPPDTARQTPTEEPPLEGIDSRSGIDSPEPPLGDEEWARRHAALNAEIVSTAKALGIAPLRLQQRLAERYQTDGTLNSLPYKTKQEVLSKLIDEKAKREQAQVKEVA